MGYGRRGIFPYPLDRDHSLSMESDAVSLA